MSLKIKEIRKSKGLKSKDIAELSGISRSHYSEIENGKKVPNITRMTAIAEALDVNVTDLIKEPGAKNEIDEISKIFNQLNDQDKKTIIQLSSALLAAKEQNS